MFIPLRFTLKGLQTPSVVTESEEKPSIVKLQRVSTPPAIIPSQTPNLSKRAAEAKALAPEVHALETEKTGPLRSNQFETYREGEEISCFL